mmetsp:Transcript_132302/g.300672  ORF Transcript_132302/g.300672 Transcript_132302/m.300672 type:complete len:330 (+) Transcript_132302:238-1227(+)
MRSAPLVERPQHSPALKPIALGEHVKKFQLIRRKVRNDVHHVVVRCPHRKLVRGELPHCAALLGADAEKFGAVVATVEPLPAGGVDLESATVGVAIPFVEQSRHTQMVRRNVPKEPRIIIPDRHVLTYRKTLIPLIHHNQARKSRLPLELVHHLISRLRGVGLILHPELHDVPHRDRVRELLRHTGDLDLSPELCHGLHGVPGEIQTLETFSLRILLGCLGNHLIKQVSSLRHVAPVQSAFTIRTHVHRDLLEHVSVKDGSALEEGLGELRLDVNAVVGPLDLPNLLGISGHHRLIDHQPSPGPSPCHDMIQNSTLSRSPLPIQQPPAL